MWPMTQHIVHSSVQIKWNIQRQTNYRQLNNHIWLPKCILPQWFPTWGTWPIHRSTWEDSWAHRPTGKWHMRGCFRGTPGRAKFSWWYSNQKKVGNHCPTPLSLLLTGVYPLPVFLSLPPSLPTSPLLWLHTGWPDHPWRTVLLPQSHQRSGEAEMAGRIGICQGLPHRQPNQERER